MMMKTRQILLLLLLVANIAVAQLDSDEEDDEEDAEDEGSEEDDQDFAVIDPQEDKVPNHPRPRLGTLISAPTNEVVVLDPQDVAYDLHEDGDNLPHEQQPHLHEQVIQTLMSELQNLQQANLHLQHQVQNIRLQQNSQIQQPMQQQQSGLLTVINPRAASRQFNCMCQCSSLAYVDRKGRIQGNCRTADDSGAVWCFVDPNYRQCVDIKWSNLQSQHWSYEACATPELTSPECSGHNGYNGNSGNNGNNGNSGNIGSSGNSEYNGYNGNIGSSGGGVYYATPAPNYPRLGSALI